MERHNSKELDRPLERPREASGKRTTKIGGAGNAQGGYYAICFAHEDPTDGDLWILIKGRNTAGATLTFAADEGTVVEPEFKQCHTMMTVRNRTIEEIAVRRLSLS